MDEIHLIVIPWKCKVPLARVALQDSDLQGVSLHLKPTFTIYEGSDLQNDL